LVLGTVRAFRRPFAEVALGLFVANLLVVSVALFSLQVYDRVISHQSEATLWVLAAGFALALLMEAFLKIARARLMDGAGRQIEVKVQGILMERLLGMRSEIASRSPSMLFSAMREFSAVREFFTASTVGTLVDIPFLFLFVFLLLVASIGWPVVWVLIIGGIIMVFAGALTVGSIIAISILTSRTLAPLTQLAGTMARWGNVKSMPDGLESIAGAARDTDEDRTYLRRETTAGGYELNEMQFVYEDGDAPTLDIAATWLPAGQAVAILGSNGSGKSMLLKVLSGLYAPSKGRVMLDGVDMAQVEPRDLRRLIGYLGQDGRLFTGMQMRKAP